MWHIFFIVNIVKIASWNVNSVRSRIGNILDWIKLEKPDILCLQETKVVDNDFPLSPFEEIGYNVKIHGQKSYNGVATLSKFLVEETFQGIPNYDDDQARYIETVHSSDLGMIRISNIYLPNGNPAPGPKYDYKLNWMKKLKNHLSETLLNEEIFIVLGDFNHSTGSATINTQAYNFHGVSAASASTLETLVQGASDSATVHGEVILSSNQAFAITGSAQGEFFGASGSTTAAFQSSLEKVGDIDLGTMVGAQKALDVIASFDD